MSSNQCIAPGCRRFVKKGARQCEHHPPPGPNDVLEPELTALREELGKLRTEKDLKLRATLIARVASVAIQAVRAQYAIGGTDTASFMETIAPFLENLEREQGHAATANEGSQP